MYNEVAELPDFNLVGRAGIADTKEIRVSSARLMQGEAHGGAGRGGR